jgi:hypothetical protein
MEVYVSSKAGRSYERHSFPYSSNTSCNLSPDYGVSFPDIVRCFAAALETMDSDQGERPSDFKYKSNLQEQVRSMHFGYTDA